MCRTHFNLYTTGQTENLLVLWGCGEPLPKKDQKVVIAFPAKGPLDVDVIEIEPTTLKGTYGDRLFKVTMSSSAGRAFDQRVQDGHVLAFMNHWAEHRRKQNLERNQALSA